MKKRIFLKTLCLLLCVCILASCLTVLPAFAAAASTDAHATKGDQTSPEVLQVLLNRDFEDGTASHNGGALSSSTAAAAMKQVSAGGNTYLRYTSQGAHDYIYYSVGNYAPDSGSVVMQMDVMVEDNTVDVPGAIQLNPQVRGSASDIYALMNIDKYGGTSQLMPFATQSKGGYPMAAGEWYTFTIVWSYNSKDSVTCTIYNGAGATATYTDTANAATGCTDVRPGQVRVGTVANATGSWCIDNIVIYTTYETDPKAAASYTIDSQNRGVLYNTNAAKYVDPDLYSGNYFLKVGINKALDATDTAVTTTEAPFTKNGKVYVPISTLTQFGITTSSLITVDGIKCVDIQRLNTTTKGQYYAVYSSMGLICITENPDISISELSTELIPIMQKFLFDGITSDLKNANAFSTEDMQSLSHPYIYANQDRFDELYAEYLSGSDSVLKEYLTKNAGTASSLYSRYAITSGGEYTGINSSSVVMPYQDAYGYDVGGRLNESAGHAGRILSLAFGYQITRNEDYARLAYDYAIELGKWEHWGPGHFLNCADASTPYAVAYDWLYNVWCDLGLDVEAIEEIIFTHSILPAYYSIHDNGCPWYDPKVSSGWSFHKSSNNWNAVCSAGVTTAALVLVGNTTAASGTMLDLTIDGVYNPDTPSYAGTTGTITRKDGKTFKTDQSGMTTYSDYCEYLVNQCIYNLPMYGLGQYIVDGSYIESNGYWSYGTNNLFKMTAALYSSTGTDYGILDAWGMDRTAYYALNTQSGDYNSWNYHDSNSTGAQDTSLFLYLGSEGGLGDKTLAGIRKKIIEQSGTTPSMYDAIYYMSDEEIGEFEFPDLQYHMEGIDGYVIRDSWDKESIYAGILGNTNNLGHGQIDSGGFVYHNGGTVWFCDVGTENYNCYGFWGANTRYTYYKMNAEGNNTLMLTSRQDTIPYGQELNGFGKMTATFDNEYGAYAIIDNTTVYGSYAKSAYRGMLFTNDRRTLVIQDEVEFKQAETAVWVGHTEQEIILSVDGKTAYMYDGKNVLKVTLIDNNSSGLKFEVTDTYDFLLDCTVGPTYSTDNGGVAENDRSAYKRLIIRCENVTSISLAVVMEEVAIGETMNTDIGYEFTPMQSWAPTADGRATNKTLGSFDFDTASSGAMTEGGSLGTDTVYVGSDNALLISALDSTVNGKIKFSANASKAEYGSIGLGLAVFELEATTASAYPEGIKIGVESNGGILTSAALSDLGSITEGEWVRITVVLDAQSCKAYYFFDGALISTQIYSNASYENISLVFTANAGIPIGTSLLVDNVNMRYFTSEYTALDSLLSKGDIADWADATPKKRTDDAVYAVARITASDGSVTTVYSFSELEEKISANSTVTLLANNTERLISINAPCTVKTGGYKLRAISENYIASVAGNTITYKTGSIDVYWVVNGSMIQESYTGSVIPTYPGASISGSLYEADNGNGTYSYYTAEGFARAEGDIPLSDEEMIITSLNNTFYVAGKKYEGAFVTVSGSNITGYEDGAKFFTSEIISGRYDRVCLTSDIEYDSTSVSDGFSFTKAFNLYFNGYTLTYHSTASSDHMFHNNAGTNTVNMYGPGGINSTSTTANILYNGSGIIYVEGLTITAPRSITDFRQGYGHFRNCEVSITRGSSAFSVLNRNNAVTNTALMPSLLIDGCNISIPNAGTTTPAFSVTANASMELNGGTTVTMGYDRGYLFSLSNNTVGTVANYDYANATNYMSAKIGNVSFNCQNLCISTTNDTSGTVYDFSDKISYTIGAVFESYPTGISIYGDGVIARQNNSVYKYVIAPASDCANVTWTVGSLGCTELWVGGSLPTPDSAELEDLINANPAADGYKYSFPAQTVSSGSTYTFTATEIKAFNILMNMTLQAEFNVNFYIPCETDGIEFTGYSLDGVYASIDTLKSGTLGGESYYRIVKSNVAPASLGATIALTVYGISGGEEISVSRTVSVVDYAKALLGSETQSEQTKALMANILKYAVSSYIYTGKNSGAEYKKVSEIYETYKHYATASVVQRQTTGELASVSSAVAGAYLHLSNVPYYYFILNPSYTGELTISYMTTTSTGALTEVSKTYTVVNGKCNGSGNIIIERKVYDLQRDVTISVGEESAVYNLAIYYHYTATELGALTNLLNALYAYCETADIYNQSITK